MDRSEERHPHRLGREAIHTCWDNTLPPRLTIAPGDTFVFETREPSQGGVARDIIAEPASTCASARSSMGGCSP